MELFRQLDLTKIIKRAIAEDVGQGDLTTAATVNVILIAGLPGCGKTTYLFELCRDGWLVFDNFKAHAFDNCSAFRKSRKFSALILALSNGVKCVVGDIDFCRTESREEADSVLRAEVPGIEISWRYFAHDKKACKANITRRNRPSLNLELKTLDDLSACYRIPWGADVRPCYRAP
ncbi:hypothetical protein [Candidatus Binatus sp.]|uniref:hypothetical protein n=1 Tax=Candidatus Binatus sp. TaxID=2811406 RepID=UPI003C362C6C